MKYSGLATAIGLVAFSLLGGVAAGAEPVAAFAFDGDAATRVRLRW